MDLLRSIQVSATGLTAQRTKVSVIAENIAHSETTRTSEGGPYRRKLVVMESKPLKKDSFAKTFENVRVAEDGVEVTKIVPSQEDFRLVYNPAHPDADPDTGYVKMPNVDTVAEMADMLVARRSYDAGVTVIDNSKSMIKKALTIGD